MAGRPTASTITDAQLDALHEQLRTLTEGAGDRETLLTEARDALEAADAGGHGNDWPHVAPGIRTLHARAERAEQLLTEYVRLADVTHTYGAMGGHDRLGANFACVGCQLRDRARTVLDGAQQAGPDGEQQHLTRGTNAEDCPACSAAAEPPPYPWLCPGPAATPATDHGTTGRTSP